MQVQQRFETFRWRFEDDPRMLGERYASGWRLGTNMGCDLYMLAGEDDWRLEHWREDIGGEAQRLAIQREVPLSVVITMLPLEYQSWALDQQRLKMSQLQAQLEQTWKGGATPDEQQAEEQAIALTVKLTRMGRDLRAAEELVLAGVRITPLPGQDES